MVQNAADTRGVPPWVIHRTQTCLDLIANFHITAPTTGLHVLPCSKITPYISLLFSKDDNSGPKHDTSPAVTDVRYSECSYN